MGVHGGVARPQGNPKALLHLLTRCRSRECAL